MTVSPRTQIFEYLDGPKVDLARPALEEMRLRDATTEQLQQYIACKRAIENADPPPPLEWEIRERTVEERLFQFAEWCRAIGVDDDLIGSDLFKKLRKFGYSDDDALDALRDAGVVWNPLSAEERLVRVATEMLQNGWSESQVRWAIDGLVA